MGRKRILIVDDEKEFVEVLKFRLQANGYAVMSAHNAERALRLARKIPDLILLDVLMPAVSGIELCQLLKEDPRLKNIPVIFLTAKDAKQDRLKGLSAGADEYIVKPFYSQELLNKIKKALKAEKQISEKKRIF